MKYSIIDFLSNQSICLEFLHAKPNPESNLLETVAARLFRSGHCTLLHVQGHLILLHERRTCLVVVTSSKNV